MSRDIRSFFRPKKVQEPKIEDDEDVVPESPHVQIKNNKKGIKRRRVLNDDSDDEIASTKPKKDEKSTSANTSRDKNKPVLKEVKPADLFGTGPIKRTQPLVQKKKNTETGIHSDDEFEKSLLEIDNIELELQINESEIPNSESKLSINKSRSKSEKLSSKEKNKKASTSSDISKDKHKHVDHSSKEKKSDNLQSSICDKKSKQSIINQSISDKKSKIDASKRKFAEFIDNDNSSDNASGKKKKLNLNQFDKNTDKSSNHANEDDNNVLQDMELDQKLTSKKLNHNHVEENIDKTMSDHSNKYNNDESIVEDVAVDSKECKKKKLNKSLNESVLTDEERHERRIQSAALYKSYLNRSGPKNLGAKQMPEGTSDCLKNCTFVLTGVLDSFEKDEVSAAINKYGGCVKSGVTKKVTHVIAGEDAGPAKLAKAQELGIKVINEDEFLKMIINRSNATAKSDNKKEIKKEKSAHKNSHKDTFKNESTSIDKIRKGDHVDSKSKKSQSSKDKMSMKEHKVCNKSKSPKKIKEDMPTGSISEEKPEIIASSSREIPRINGSSKPDNNVHDKLTSNTSMWVEKYKPKTIKQIIGQQGDASNVKKLMNWLTKWYVNRKAKLPKPNPWAKNDDGGYYKAALLSGPPGVGKTTTVSLVCHELGFDMVEYNASDTRNKTLIKEQIGELLTTTSLSGFARGETGKKAVTKKHVLIMDEVDGMAGNEDRGGLQELIALIKSASVPIICMCNDRNSQKMRSLVNYCYDLRFNRPRVDQIKSAMMSICFKESIKIPPDVLAQLITSANQDVRQTLNLLSMWAIEPTLADADRLRRDAQTTKKDVKLGPWEAIRKVFSAEDHKTMSINDKSDLFFYDYSLAPLFVQENYLQVAPHCPKHEVLQRINHAADNISLGDLVDARIRGSQAWSLLPVQAMYASVLPGHHMSGHMAGQIQFPGWLGKNSRATKMRRLCQEIHAHTRLSTSGSKSSIFLDYATHIRDAIVNPLIKNSLDGVDKSLEVLESYHLLREDLDSLIELSVWSGQRNPTVLIDPKVKAAMTRTYNKKAAALPYAPGAVKRGRGTDLDDTGEEDLYEEEAPDSDPENDALIKKKKAKDADKPGPSKGKTSKPTSKKKKEK